MLKVLRFWQCRIMPRSPFNGHSRCSLPVKHGSALNGLCCFVSWLIKPMSSKAEISASKKAQGGALFLRWVTKHVNSFYTGKSNATLLWTRRHAMLTAAKFGDFQGALHSQSGNEGQRKEDILERKGRGDATFPSIKRLHKNEVGSWEHGMTGGVWPTHEQ